ncbi:MAG: hypothetical protein JKY48_04210 [Flavobacteriales bacterium]|nr:hypothetical protein [Flavobacteriales bacterium]
MKNVLLFVLLFSSAFIAIGHEEELDKTPTFIENTGQWNSTVLFKAELEGATLYFEPNAFHYQFIQRANFHAGNVPDNTDTKGHNFKASFIGSNEHVEIEKQGRSYFYHNYFIGSEKEKWRDHVYLYEQIRYKNLYTGIDLLLYKKDGFLKYDYCIAPGNSVGQIEVSYDGVEKPLLKDGQLIIQHQLGDLIEEKPYAYQFINGIETEVICHYQLSKEGTLSFEFPNSYDKGIELIIDPRLIFSTYSGSKSNNFGETATYDKDGNAYMGGITEGSGYDTTLGAFQTFYAGGDWDVSISKFNPTGDSLLYSTFLGGSGNETVHSLVVDTNLNLYALGATGSSNFPFTTGAHDSSFQVSFQFQTDIGVTFSNGSDIFVSKFNSDGSSLIGSTYFGGDGLDGINPNPGGGNIYNGLNSNYGDSHRGEIVVDSMGFCYIGTTTTSTDLSVLKGGYNGGQDGLIVKFGSDLDTVIWSKYIGGTGRDAIYSLKVIDSNKVLIGGGTTSYDDFPTTTGSYQSSSIQDRSVTIEEADGFIAIISPNGDNIEKCTFISTPNYDQVYFIEFDRFNNIYGYGQSEGGDFPILRAPLANSTAGQFIIKLDKNLDSLEFSTTFGDGQSNGTLNISPTAFLVDKCQNIYTAGWGGSIRAQERLKRLTNNSQPIACPRRKA